MPDEINWDSVVPADESSSGGVDQIDWNSVTPIDTESSAGLRERLKFNLQNDYAPDQGGLFDQAILGLGQGGNQIMSGIAGLGRFTAPIFSAVGSMTGPISGLQDVGPSARRLSQFTRENQASLDDTGDTLGASPTAQMVRTGASFVPGMVPLVLGGGVGALAGRAAIGMAGAAGLQTLGATEEAATQANQNRGFDEAAAEAKARIPAAIGGALSAGLNLVWPGGAKALLGAFGAGEVTQTTIGDIIRNVAKESVKQGLLSGTDSAVQGILSKLTYDPERTLKDIATGAWEAAGTGTAMGLGIGAASTASAAARGALAAYRGRGAREDAAFAQARPINADATQPETVSLRQLGYAEPTPEAPPTPEPIAPTEPPVTPSKASSADRQVKVASKILQGAGFSSDESLALADQFVGARGSEFPSTGEDFRAALLNHVEQAGVKPSESISLYQEDPRSYEQMGISQDEAKQYAAHAKEQNAAARAAVEAQNQAIISNLQKGGEPNGQANQTQLQPESKTAVSRVVSGTLPPKEGGDITHPIVGSVVRISGQIVGGDDNGKEFRLDKTVAAVRRGADHRGNPTVHLVFTDGTTSHDQVIGRAGITTVDQAVSKMVGDLDQLNTTGGKIRWVSANATKQPAASPETIPANPETTTPIPETIQPPVVAKSATAETALPQAERDISSPQNIKTKIASGEFPVSFLPEEFQRELKGWNVVSKSPYGNSFYDITNKGWTNDPDGFLRIADHWNWRDDDGRTHAKTDKPVRDGDWTLAKYDAGAGVYRVVKSIARSKASDLESRFGSVRNAATQASDILLRAADEVRADSEKAKGVEKRAYTTFFNKFDAKRKEFLDKRYPQWPENLRAAVAAHWWGGISNGRESLVESLESAALRGFKEKWTDLLPPTVAENATVQPTVDDVGQFSESEKDRRWNELMAEVDAREKQRKDFSDSIEANFAGGLEFKTSNGSSLILSPNIDPKEGKFRITLITEGGHPWGHTVHSSLRESANELIIRGADPKDLPEALRNAQGVKSTRFDWEAATPVEGVRVKGNYDVVDVSNLVTSFDKGFDQSLQPRDRSRAASKNQIASIAMRLDPARLTEAPTTDTGAPIVDERNQVLSGNGRTAAIREAYDGGRADAYRASLIANAERYGVSPDAIAGMKNPVLVRRVGDYGGISKEEFTYQSNKDPLLGMGESETATADARMILENPKLLASFAPSGEGDVLADSNRDFLNQFIQGTGDQASLLSKDGYNGPALEKRVKTAILAAMIGPKNRQAISTLLESAEKLGLKNVVNGLTSAAPRLLQLKGTTYDLTNQMAQAVQDLIRIRSEGGKIEDFLNQSDLFGDSGRTAESDFILQRLFETKSANKVSQPMARYVELAKRIGTTVDAFRQQPSKLDLLKQAYATDNAASAIQENFALGKSPPGSQAANAAPNAPDGSVQGATRSAAAEATIGPRKAAVGIKAVHALVDSSTLSPDEKALAHAILDVANKSEGLGDAIQMEIVDSLRVRSDGVTQAGGVIGTLIKLAESVANANTVPHEVFHILFDLLPKEVQDKIESARLAILPDNVAEFVTPEQIAKIKAGTMTSGEFFASKLPQEYYRFINREEFFARFAEKKFAREHLGDDLGQRIQNWFRDLWEAIKNFFRSRNLKEHVRNMDEAYADAVSGKNEFDSSRFARSKEERATFVQTGEEAAQAAMMAEADSPEMRQAEGRELVAQSSDLVKFIDRYKLDTLPKSAQTALKVQDLKAINAEGARLFGSNPDFQSLRAQTPGEWHDRLGIVAIRWAINFRHNLEGLAANGEKAVERLNSEPIQNRIKKMQAALLAGTMAEDAYSSAVAAIGVALNAAKVRLKQERLNDLDAATLEGEIRGLEATGQSTVAMHRALDDITAVLSSTPEGKAALMGGATARDIATIYRDLKKSTGQSVANDQLIRVASYLLSQIPEIRDQLLASRLAHNTATMGQANSLFMDLLDKLKKDPAGTLERIMRERDKRMGTMKDAQFLFEQMQKRYGKDLDEIYGDIQSGKASEAVLADPEFKQHIDTLMLQSKGYSKGKPFEPFILSDAPDGVVESPDGTKATALGSDLMTANQKLIESRYTEAQTILGELNSWLDDHGPNHPDYNSNFANREKLQEYWGSVQMLTPNSRDSLIPWSMSILNKTIREAGGRLAPQVNTAVARLDAMSHAAAGWNSKATNAFESDFHKALRAQGIKWNNYTKNDLVVAAKLYDKHFQELANSWQHQAGGLNVGDKTMTGRTVTPEDMKLLRNQHERGADSVAIVDKFDKQVTADTLGLPKGVTLYRKASTAGPLTLTRPAKYDRITDAEPISKAYQAHVAKPSEATLANLSRAIDEVWENDGPAFIRQRIGEFAKPTIFDGKDGAFKLVAKEIQNGRKYPTFDSAVKRFAQLTPASLSKQGQTPSLDIARDVLAREFARQIDDWHRAAVGDTDPNNPIVHISGGDPTNSFTMPRGNQLAPWTWYQTGWSTSGDVRSHAGQMVAVAQTRVLRGMEAQLADLDRQATELKKAEEKGKITDATRANYLAQWQKKGFDNWFNLDHRRGALQARINELKAVPVLRSDASKVFGRYVSGTVRVLISGTQTMFRNVGAVYPWRTMNASGLGNMRAMLGAFGIGTVQIGKMIGTLGASYLMTPFRALKGLADGVRVGIKDKETSQLWRQVVKEVAEGMGRSSIKRLADVREMIDAGIMPEPHGGSDVENELAAGLYRTIGDKAYSPATKAALLPILFFESTVLPVVTAAGPHLGDATVNTMWWKLITSPRLGYNRIFGTKVRALKKRIDSGNYRAFDIANPTSAINTLTPKDINESVDGLNKFRTSFNQAGLNFDAIVADYVRRLGVDPNAEFMSKADLVKMANWGIDQYNRASASNQPQIMKGHSFATDALKQLLNWQTRSLAAFSDFFSIPTEVGKEVATYAEGRRAKMKQWMAKAVTAGLLGTMVVGAASELEGELISRTIKSVMLNMESNNRWPWQHDNQSKAIQAFERFGLQSVPLVAIPANLILPNTSPARSSVQPTFVLITKMQDLSKWASYGIQTGNWWYKTPQTIGNFMQDSQAVLNRLPSQAGLRIQRNAAAILRVAGPDELQKQFENKATAPSNLTKLSPYGELMWNAAFKGDIGELKALKAQALAVARELGKEKPEESVKQLFENGNPSRQAFTQLPSSRQYHQIKAKISAGHLIQLQEAETNFRRGAEALGYGPPAFYKPTTESSILRDYNRRVRLSELR